MRKILLVICSLVMASQSVVANPPSVSNNTQGASVSLYKIILPIIEYKTALPVILPPSPLLRKMFDFNVMLQPANINFARSDAYSINLDASRDCNGAPICSVGNLYAAKIDKRIPTNVFQHFPISKQQLQQMNDNGAIHLPQHQTIQLPDGSAGYLETAPTAEKSNTVFNTFTWVKNNTVYQLTLKGLSKEQFIRVANATINHYVDSNNVATSLAK